MLGYGPIAYWPDWDALGSPTAEELVNSPAQDGAHTAVTLGQPGIGDGRTSGWYDGATSFTNVFTPVFQGVFNGSEGTAMVWPRANDVGVWTDGESRDILHFRADISNFVKISRIGGVNNRINAAYKAAGIWSERNVDGLVTTDWVHWAITWSGPLLANEMRLYLNGVQQGAPVVGLGAWAGAPTSALIGANTAVPSRVWHGWLAHVAVFDYAIPPADIWELAQI